MGRLTGMASRVWRISLWSLRLAPSITAPRGTPRPSVSSERLTPRLPRSVGLGPVFSPTERRLAHRPVQCQPRPVNAPQRVIGQQPLAPERREHTGRQPFLEAPVGRGGRADRRSRAARSTDTPSAARRRSRPSPPDPAPADCGSPTGASAAPAAAAPSWPIARPAAANRHPEHAASWSSVKSFSPSQIGGGPPHTFLPGYALILQPGL